MITPGLIEIFRYWARARQGFPTTLLAVDPGGTTGIVEAYIEPNRSAQRRVSWHSAFSVPLAELPAELANRVHYADAVVCEDYSSHGRTDPKAPAAIGIGMAWSECDRADIPLFLFQPNMKAAGRRALDQQGLDARARAKNDHQRDVIDLAGKALDELRKAGT